LGIFSSSSNNNSTNNIVDQEPVASNDIRMASVISSGTSPMSGFSPADDDMESWHFLDADRRGSASLQELAGSLGLDTSPSVVSQGSWGVIGSAGAHQQQQQQQQQHHHYHHQHQHMFLQTPSPGPLMDQSTSVSPMNGAQSFANGSPAGVGSGAAGFGFPSSPMHAQQHISQGQFVIEALQNGQTFGVGTTAAAFFQNASMDGE
jgi:hypothetical protein